MRQKVKQLMAEAKTKGIPASTVLRIANVKRSHYYSWLAGKKDKIGECVSKDKINQLIETLERLLR